MRSAASTLDASASFITPRFIVLERGSRTAGCALPRVLPQPLDGGADGRRVVGEIIVDRHLAGAPLHLHAPAHARKAAEGFERLGRLDADMASRGDRG